MYRFSFCEVPMLSFFPLLLLTSGSCALIYYRAVLLSPKKLFSPLLRADRAERKRARSTLLLALSGTLGVGNITGVATALLLGGEGSVFWMILSSILAVALKYAEATLSVSYGKGGGMAGVLKRIVPYPVGGILALLYSLAFLLLALVLGAAVQSNAIIENAAPHLNIRKEILSLLLTFALALLLFGKVSRILRALTFTLPIATVVYVLLCLCVLFSNLPLLPSLLLRILKSALQGTRPVVSGVVGSLTKAAIREGFFAGLLSNEAGAGTSAMAHEENASLSQAGAIGTLEVLFDTAFLCTLSALTFLIQGGNVGATSAGEVIYQTFYPLFGVWYLPPLLFSVILFAVSTSLCYFIYARRTLCFLKRERLTPLYTVLFLSFLYLGGRMESTPLVVLSHAILAVLVALSGIAILTAVLGGKQKASDTGV